MSSTQKKSLIYLTPERGLFIGHMPLEFGFRQPKPSLIVGLEGDIKIHCSGQELVTRSLAVPAGKRLKIQLSNSLVANIMLSRLDLDFQLLSDFMKLFRDGIYYRFLQEEVFRISLLEVYEKEYELNETFDLLVSKIMHLNFERKEAYIDKRIERVIDSIRQDPHENVPIERLAELATLSVPRLVQLFKQQVGVPIRKYRQWRRLYETANGLATSQTVSQAAMDAGFNDAPHFCNTFKEMFGVSPSTIFTPETRVVIKK